MWVAHLRRARKRYDLVNSSSKAIIKRIFKHPLSSIAQGVRRIIGTHGGHESPKIVRSKTKIHKEDYIYQFLVSHPSFPTEASAREYYFASGKESVVYLKELVNEYGIEPCESLLEFASGYGCVSRHFTAVFPEISVTACDIHPAAVTFVSKQFGIPAVPSTPIPEEFHGNRSFDVVFALSFFSHMPKTTWTRWLKALIMHTRVGGLIIFTTHGLKSWEIMGRPELGADGFWFAPKASS